MPRDTIKIKLGNIDYSVIDLTQPLSLDTEVYPGDPKPTREVFSNIKETGWHHYIHRIGDHNFQPHGDAPSHQNPELIDKGFEVFDVGYCFNTACLVDLSESKETKEFNGVRYLVEVKKEHLLPYAKQLLKVGAIVIRTGYDRWLEKNKPHNAKNLPFLSENVANYIASFSNIKVVGTDSLTVDVAGNHTSHKILKDRLIVESLVHLHEIPQDKKLKFILQTSPIRIVGATGGPIVAYAFIQL